MRPTPAEQTACTHCGAPIFFALTVNGERQALDVEPRADGPVMAYRAEPRLWLARTLPRERPADAGEQLALEAVGDDPRPRPRERQPHPLEEAFMPHGDCTSRRGVQGSLFGPAVPAPRPAPNQIYNVKAGASHGRPVPREGGAKVYEFEQIAPRIAARRRRSRTARPSDAGAS